MRAVPIMLGQKRKMFSSSAGCGEPDARALPFPFMRTADWSSCGEAGADLPDGEDASRACAACLLVWRVVIVGAGARELVKSWLWVIGVRGSCCSAFCGWNARYRAWQLLTTSETRYGLQQERKRGSAGVAPAVSLALDALGRQEKGAVTEEKQRMTKKLG